jgi:single-stranded DNA-specific DHH superfamily exonuclease
MTTLIVHHWDTDGICSASIVASILDYLGESWKNITPPIGLFDFDERIWGEIDRATDIFVLDLNVPKLIEKIDKNVTFIDHHIQPKIDKPNVEHVNPIVDGKSEKDYPSASWVISDYFSIWNHLSALGALGDVGDRLFDWDIGKKALQLLLKSGLQKKDAIKLVSMLDSNYIVMDRIGVEKSVKTLIESEPTDLLENSKWLKNLNLIEKDVWKALSNAESRKNYTKIEFKSRYNIISKVVRKAVWVMGHKVVVAVNREFGDCAQLYLRIKPELAESVNVPAIINELKLKGFNVGGKRDVLGLICPKQRIDEALEIVEGML